MDKFQQAQQANAESLRIAALEEAQRAQKSEAEKQSMLREAERQANIAKNLGNAGNS